MPVFINVVGHNASGKSTLSKKLGDDLGINIVSGDDMRNLIASHIKYYKEVDFSYRNPKASSLWSLLDFYRITMAKILLEQGQSVLVDGSGFDKQKRKLIFNSVSELPDVLKIIIYTQVDEETLIKRLENRDKEHSTRWLDFYKDIRRDLFQPPKAEESDKLLIYTQNNYDEIKSQISYLIRSS